MKELRALYAIAFVLAGAAGWLYWDAFGPSRKTPSPASLTAAIRRDFEENTRSSFSVDIDELRKSRASLELTQPESSLPRSFSFEFGEIAELARYAETCRSAPPIRRPELRKALEWHRYACGELRELSSGFFERSPFMHPSGESYVMRAVRSGRPEFANPKWRIAQSSRIHLRELLAQANPPITVTPGQLDDLLRGDGLVMSERWTLLAKAAEAQVGYYRAYSRNEWDRFVESRGFRIVAPDSPGCQVPEGSVCWAGQPQLQSARWIVGLVLVAMSLLAAALIVLIFRKSSQSREQAQQRQFILQVLTHELRTPATALHLSLEPLRDEFDRLSPNSQRAFLRICEELQRLGRLVEASGSYLQAEQGSRLLALADRPPVDLRDLVNQAGEPFANRLAVRLPEEAVALRVDRYWLELCLRNLLENAFAHGKAPVELSLKREGLGCVIAIQDQGTVGQATLEELAKPFRKRSESSGLGLGLTIVRRVVNELGGELSLAASPTRFEIRFRRSE